MRLTEKASYFKKVMTKKIGNVRKKFLKRERVMLIIEHLTRSEVQNHWTPAQRKR